MCVRRGWGGWGVSKSGILLHISNMGYKCNFTKSHKYVQRQKQRNKTKIKKLPQSHFNQNEVLANTLLSVKPCFQGLLYKPKHQTSVSVPSTLSVCTMAQSSVQTLSMKKCGLITSTFVVSVKQISVMVFFSPSLFVWVAFNWQTAIFVI